MAKITVEEQPNIETFPEDSILELKIEECDVRTVNGARGEWQKVEFKFKILGVQAIGDGSPVEKYDAMITQNIWGSVPFRLTDSPENKLRQWAEAILQMELGVGFELDTDVFVGRKVRGLTSTYVKKTRDAEYTRHQVESLLPAGGGFATAAPTQGHSFSTPPTPPAGDPWAAPAQPAPSLAQQQHQQYTQPGPASQDPWGSVATEPPF